MPKPSFMKDLKAGREGEGVVLSLLSESGINCRENLGESRDEKSTHDIEIEVGGEWVTAEIKRDIYENKSGNLAIEHRNPKADKPSGLTATTAKLWILVLKESVWVCRTDDLRRHHSKGKEAVGWHRELPKCGDGNASVTLYNSEVLRTEIFHRLDSLPAGELLALLEVLI